MIGFENTFYASVEIVEVEVVGHFLLLFRYHLEIRSNQFQAPYHAIDLVKASFREQIHYEIVQQFFIGYQLHRALPEGAAVVDDFIPIHFP